MGMRSLSDDRTSRMRFTAVERVLRRCITPLLPKSVKSYLRPILRNIRFRTHTHIGRSPSLFFSFHALLGDYQGRTVSSATEIVIEGAPRVASTYCVTAFLVAQDRPVTVATHTHLPANVLGGVRMRIPTLVIIREPREAVRSAVLRNNDLTLTAVLERYFHFYRPLERIREELIIADFEEATSEFGAIIERINTRYDTNFELYINNSENEAAVKAILHQKDILLGVGDLGSYYPNPQKQIAKPLIDIEKHRLLLRRCEEIYHRLSPLFGNAIP